MAGVVTDRIERIHEKNQQLTAHVAKLEHQVVELQDELEEKKLVAEMTQRQLLHEQDSNVGQAWRGAPNTASQDLLQQAMAENGRLTAENRRLAVEFERAAVAHRRAEAQLQHNDTDAQNRRLASENRDLRAEVSRLTQAHQKSELVLAQLQANTEKQAKRRESRTANAVRAAREAGSKSASQQVALLQNKIKVMDGTIREHAKREEAAARAMLREKEVALEEAKGSTHDATSFERSRSVKLNSDEAKEAVLALVNDKRKAAKGAVGYMTLTLSWDTKTNLNLCLVCPDVQRIHHRNREAHGGRLDVATERYEPLQNIVFDERPMEGVYHIKVLNLEQRVADRCTPVPFDLVVQIGGLVYALHSHWEPDSNAHSSTSMDICELTMHAGTHWLTPAAKIQQLGKIEGSAGLDRLHLLGDLLGENLISTISL